MKKILLITLTLLMVVTSFATTPSLLNEWNWKPQPLNLILIGAGVGLSGYGIKMMFTF